MIDEMGLRALWAKELSEESFGVTFSIDTKYRKPVPYGCRLAGRGRILTQIRSKSLRKHRSRTLTENGSRSCW